MLLHFWFPIHCRFRKIEWSHIYATLEKWPQFDILRHISLETRIVLYCFLDRRHSMRIEYFGESGVVCKDTFWCLINASPVYQFVEIFDPKIVNLWCKKCNKLSSSHSISRLFCQNYIPRPNDHFRSCFAPLWGLALKITSKPTPLPFVRHWRVPFDISLC